VFAAGALAGGRSHHETDDRPLCSCGPMKECLQQKLHEFDQTRNRCDNQCAAQMPHHAEMKPCLKAKWAQKDEMLQKMLVCVTTGEHNMCQNVSHTVEEHKSSKSSEERGEDEKPKMELFQMLKPYGDCMKTCMNSSEDQEHHKHDQAAKDRHESKHGWKHFTRQMWGGLGKCKKALSCKLEHNAKKASVGSCMKSTGVNKDAFCTLKKDFCKCARGALGKTEEEMPCNWDDEHTEEPHVAHTTAAHAAHGQK